MNNILEFPTQKQKIKAKVTFTVYVEEEIINDEYGTIEEKIEDIALFHIANNNIIPKIEFL